MPRTPQQFSPPSTLFRLQGSPSTHYPHVYQVDFSPVKALDILDAQPHFKNFSILPVFNHDQCYYSQGFITPYDGQQDDCQMWNRHSTKLIEQSIQIQAQEILFPKPRHQSMACFVCKSVYTDYLQHTQSVKHQRALRRNKYQNYIEEVSEQMKMQRIRNQSKRNKK